MISASPELVAIVRRWNDAVRTCDTKTLDNLLSPSSQLRYIGTAVNEVWGGDILRRGLGDHFAEIPKFHYGDQKTEAHEVGNVGWALWQGQIIFDATGICADYRISFVFILESGTWKIIHMHLSNPTSEYAALEVEHSALDDLMAAAAKGSLGLGRATSATIMFTDVVDSSALASAMGDQAWMSRIDTHLTTIQTIVEDAGGTLVKSLGDGTMSTFTSIRAALSSAQMIQRAVLDDTETPLLRIRVGLHSGDVIENKGDFFGTVVNKAARINAAATQDEIRLSDATKILLGREEGFDISDPQEVSLKGIDGMHRIYRLSY